MESSVAADFLKLLAYFDHQTLWFELFEAGSQDNLPEWLRSTVVNSNGFEHVMQILVEYCFVEVNARTGSYNLHSCVHDWIYACLNEDVDPQKHAYAFNCVVNSVGRDKRLYSYLSNAKYVPHALRLMYGNFNNLFLELSCSDYYDAKAIVKLLKYQNQRRAAEKTMQQVLDTLSHRFEPHHEYIISAQHSLADVYRRLRKFSEAEEMYLRALAGSEAISGPDHIHTLRIVGDLGYLYLEQGKPEQSEQMQMRSLSVAKKTLGSDHIDVLSAMLDLGDVHLQQGRYGKAEEFLVPALAGYEKRLGPDHIETLRVVRKLSGVYYGQHKLALARELGRRTFEGRTKVLGHDHSITLRCMLELAQICSEERAFWDEASSLYASALEITEARWGTDSSRTQKCLSKMVAFQSMRDSSERSKSKVRLTSSMKSGPVSPASKSARFRALIFRSKS